MMIPTVVLHAAVIRGMDSLPYAEARLLCDIAAYAGSQAADIGASEDAASDAAEMILRGLVNGAPIPDPDIVPLVRLAGRLICRILSTK